MTKRFLFALAFFSLAVSGVLGDSHFPPPSAKILLLGTFHFADPGLDEFKPEFDVDITSRERKAELEEVLAALGRFAPTKIAVEVLPSRQEELDASYRSYLAGEKELTSNEIHQLGFRLAERLGHGSVYAVDAKRRFYEPWVDPDEYASEHGQTEVAHDPWPERYTALYQREDRAKTQRTLTETLLTLNEEERLLRHHGRYLVESFKAGVGEEYPGVDSKIAWYNRNLRIFANLQRITEREDERILLIIGAGHVPILRHTVQASPEYTLVEVADVLQEAVSEPSAPATARAPERSVEDQLLISPATPSFDIRVADELSYVGRFDFEIIASSDEYPVELQGQPVASGERFVFVSADSDNAVEKLFIVQYEGFLPDNDFIYRYDFSNAGSIGGHKFRHNIWIYDARQNALDNPLGEGAKTLAFLAEKGLSVEPHFMMSRFVGLASEDRKHEIIVFYQEMLKATTGQTLETLARLLEPEVAQIEDALEQRARASFAIE